MVVGLQQPGGLDGLLCFPGSPVLTASLRERGTSGLVRLFGDREYLPAG